MNDTKASKIFESCVNEMYQNSTPPTTWNEIKEQYGGSRKTFHDKHFITEREYNRIRNKYCKRLNTYYRQQLSWFLLDYAPAFKRE